MIERSTELSVGNLDRWSRQCVETIQEEPKLKYQCVRVEADHTKI